MSPYYTDDAVTLWHGDCREILPTLPRIGVDVVVTDPPFFMPATHYSSRTRWQRAWGDTSILSSFWGQVLDLLIPHMRPTGYLLTFCDGDSYPVFYPETYRRFDSLSSLVWDKGRIGMGSPWRKQHELILAARWADAFKSDQRGCADVFKVPPIIADDREHPVDKPPALIERVIAPVLPAGGVFCDPFMGGGSGLIAARNLGAKVVGIDTEERYCEVAARRLAQDVLDFGGAA